jgi:hypothetical protein
MNKKLSLFPFLSVIALGMPAYAVDYVACREMLRTKNEMILKAQEIEKEWKQLFYYKRWGDFREKTKISEDSMNIGCPKEKFNDEIEDKNTFLTKYEWCRSRFSSYMKQKLFEDEERKHSREYTNPEAIKWIKAGNKVQADMKKADCPYE